MNPTCSRCSLQVAVRIIAVTNLFWTGILIVIETLLMSRYGIAGMKLMSPELSGGDIEGFTNTTQCNYRLYSKYTCGTLLSSSSEELSTEKAIDIGYEYISDDNIVSIIWLLSWIIDIGFSLLLYRSAITRSRGKCLAWYYFRLGVLIFRVLFLTLYTILGLSMITKIPVIIFFIYRIYTLWVVKLFINELTMELVGSSSGEGNIVAAENSIDKKLDSNAIHAEHKSDLEVKKALRNSRRLSSPFLVYKI